jgi:hypothetical protein
MDSATNHGANQETVKVWQRWRRARRRRERDNAALELWQLCEGEIWGQPKSSHEKVRRRAAHDRSSVAPPQWPFRGRHAVPEKNARTPTRKECDFCETFETCSMIRVVTGSPAVSCWKACMRWKKPSGAHCAANMWNTNPALNRQCSTCSGCCA